MFKVWVQADSSQLWASNGIEHDTQSAAETAAKDLFQRWFAVNEWAVLPASDEFVGFLSAEVVSNNAVSRG